MHGLSSLNNKTHAVIETEGSSRSESGVLTKAVARAKTWFDTEALDSVENHQTRDECRELCVASVFQLIGIGIEQQATDISTRNIRSFFDEFP
jgi:hypothetical protein